MFKKIHSFQVFEVRLVDVLKILDTLGVKVFTIKNLDPQYKDQWYISVDVNKKTWELIKKAIYADSQIGGMCSDFQ